MVFKFFFYQKIISFIDRVNLEISRIETDEGRI